MAQHITAAPRVEKPPPERETAAPGVRDGGRCRYSQSGVVGIGVPDGSEDSPDEGRAASFILFAVRTDDGVFAGIERWPSTMGAAHG